MIRPPHPLPYGDQGYRRTTCRIHLRIEPSHPYPRCVPVRLPWVTGLMTPVLRPGDTSPRIAVASLRTRAITVCHLGGEGVPDRRRARVEGLRRGPAARGGRVSVGTADGHGRTRGTARLHPRRDRGSTDRRGRGVRDPAAAGRPRFRAELCVPAGRGLAVGHRLGAHHRRAGTGAR